MQVVYERCCGIDVHKRNLVACVITPEGKELRSFGTMTVHLLELADWLEERGVTHVAIESTGVYWKPVYNLLEGCGVELLVVNAQHIKAVPGRKTDVKDAEWIADLLRHGLLRGSYIPSREQRELRELVRYRKTLIRERSAEVNRLQKTLEGANIKLASVVSDVTGKSGRAMLEALVAGTTDPKELAGMALGQLQNKRAQLEQALYGLVGRHQQVMIAAQLRHIDFLDHEIEALSGEIEERLRPFEQSLAYLDSIPGVGRRTAEMILAEIGFDMERFPTAGHLASWAGMCPGNNESAGRRKSGRTRKGSPWLREALVEAAQTAARTRNTYLASQYHRIAARRGAKRAVVAVGHTILVIAYHLLKHQTPYTDLGANYFDEQDKMAILRRSVKRLEKLGYKVSVGPAA
jgi:transposase